MAAKLTKPVSAQMAEDIQKMNTPFLFKHLMQLLLAQGLWPIRLERSKPKTKLTHPPGLPPDPNVPRRELTKQDYMTLYSYGAACACA